MESNDSSLKHIPDISETTSHPEHHRVPTAEERNQSSTFPYSKKLGKYCRTMTVLSADRSDWMDLQLELPYDVYGSSAVFLHNELYVVGGSRNPKALYKLDKNLEWKQLADMNVERRFITNSCLEANGYIWVFGGRDGDRNDLKSVERYDPKEDKWTLMPEMSTARSRAAAVFWKDRIIISGGRTEEGWSEEDCCEERTNSAECFLLETGEWTQFPSLPDCLVGHSLVSFENKLILMGGYNQNGFLKSVSEMDPLQPKDGWKSLPPMNYSHGFFSGLVLDQEIYAVGGYFGTDLDTVEIFDGKSWRDGPSLPYGRYNHSVVVIPQSLADRLCQYKLKEETRGNLTGIKELQLQISKDSSKVDQIQQTVTNQGKYFDSIDRTLDSSSQNTVELKTILMMEEVYENNRETVLSADRSDWIQLELELENKWTLMPEMSTARADAAAVFWKDRIIVGIGSSVGGICRSEKSFHPEHHRVPTGEERYQSSTLPYSIKLGKYCDQPKPADIFCSIGHLPCRSDPGEHVKITQNCKGALSFLPTKMSRREINQFKKKLSDLISRSNGVSGEDVLRAAFFFCSKSRQATTESHHLFDFADSETIQLIEEAIPLIGRDIGNVADIVGLESVQRLRIMRSALEFIKDAFAGGILHKNLTQLLEEDEDVETLNEKLDLWNDLRAEDDFGHNPIDLRGVPLSHTWWSQLERDDSNRVFGKRD